MNEQIMETLNDTVDEELEDMDVIGSDDLIAEDDGSIKGILATLSVLATAGVVCTVIYKNRDKFKDLRKKHLKKKIERLYAKYQACDSDSENSVEENSIDCEPENTKES